MNCEVEYKIRVKETEKLKDYYPIRAVYKMKMEEMREDMQYSKVRTLTGEMTFKQVNILIERLKLEEDSISFIDGEVIVNFSRMEEKCYLELELRMEYSDEIRLRKGDWNGIKFLMLRMDGYFVEVK